MRNAGVKAATVAVATVGALVVPGIGSAGAAPFNCGGEPNKPSRNCTAFVKPGGARLFRPDGSLYTTLPGGTQVLVTCYYKVGGNYQDHVTNESIPHPITGHIADVSIDFNGNNPDQSPVSLDHC